MNLIAFLMAILFAPLLVSIIYKTKASMAGRKGPKWFQSYWDLSKLMRKQSLYSNATSWIFRVTPVINVVASLLVLLMLPLNGWPPAIAFPGDLIVIIFLLALMRFFTILAALDTGSSFEGMGASREAVLSSLTEPVFFLILFSLAKLGHSLEFSKALLQFNMHLWSQDTTSIFLLAGAIFILLLTENARMPVDDPTTHLELTMIHEVMLLDTGGPDLAWMEYASSLKLWIFCSIWISIVCPIKSSGWINLGWVIIGMGLVGVSIGLVESSMARLKLSRVPLFIAGSFVLTLFAMIHIWSAIG